MNTNVLFKENMVVSIIGKSHCICMYNFCVRVCVCVGVFSLFDNYLQRHRVKSVLVIILHTRVYYSDDLRSSFSLLNDRMYEKGPNPIGAMFCPVVNPQPEKVTRFLLVHPPPCPVACEDDRILLLYVYSVHVWREYAVFERLENRGWV